MYAWYINIIALTEPTISRVTRACNEELENLNTERMQPLNCSARLSCLLSAHVARSTDGSFDRQKLWPESFHQG